MTPVVRPVAAGVKMRGSSTLAPGLIRTGTGNVPNENSLPCFDLEVIFRALLPVFESWME
jgi:hypothetical protein